ncbi:MAG TPA: NnrU family protein [Burkholderiaceae bacterium]|nr:NnrU family protein [Burkholderiaceae bacterium]
MLVLIAGIVLFLGVHSTRMVAEGWREATIARVGEGSYKGLYSVVSIVGFALLVWGYALARQHPVVLWTPPIWARHLAAPLVLIAFVMLAAAYVPGNGIKARLHHPFVLGVKTWAFAHLLANGTLADLLLFGSFLAWGVFSFRAARRRDRAAGTVYPPGSMVKTALTVLVGVMAWALFAFVLHERWIGVRPY